MPGMGTCCSYERPQGLLGEMQNEFVSELDRSTYSISGSIQEHDISPDAGAGGVKRASLKQEKSNPTDQSEEQINSVVVFAQRTLGLATLSDWQKAWCTPSRMSIFLRGRKGDVEAAGKLVAQALQWRDQHQALLTGKCIPRWQGDMRLLCQGHAGHPLLYASHRFQTESYNPQDMVEHAAVVLETAVRIMPPSVHQIDAVFDLKHFQIRYNLDPRGAIAAAELLKYAFRDVLRCILCPSRICTILHLCIFLRMLSSPT